MYINLVLKESFLSTEKFPITDFSIKNTVVFKYYADGACYA